MVRSLARLSRNRSNCRLYLSQIYALDRFLSLHRLDLLAKPLLSEMAACEQFRFVIPGYSLNRRRFLSIWDVKTRDAIASRIVLRSSVRNFMTIDIDEDKIHREYLLPDANACIVTIGSPRAFKQATETLMHFYYPSCENTYEWKAIGDRPFFFVWPDRQEAADSPFARSTSELTNQSVRNKVEHEKAWAFVICNRDREFDEYAICRNETHGEPQWLSYACLCSRWYKDSLQICCLGATGPATAAVVRCLDGMTIPEKPDDPDRPGDVVWYAVEALIEGPRNPESEPGDARKIVRARIISGPNFWPV